MLDKLREIRKEKGMTQAELAKLAGLSQPYVCQLENGYEKNPTKDTIESLAGALGVKVWELIGGEMPA